MDADFDNRTQTLTLINTAVSTLVGIADQNAVFSLVGSSVHALLPQAKLILATMVPDMTALRIVWQYGFNGYLDAIRRLLGKDPLTMDFPTKQCLEQEMAMYRDGKLHFFDQSLYVLAFRSIPQIICKGIETLVGIGSIYCIGFSWNGQHYGGLVILLPKNAGMHSEEAITTIMHQSTIAIQRLRAEAALRESRERFEFAVRSAHMGVWEFDIVENKRLFDSQACHLLGINPATFKGTSEEFYSIVHPDDSEKIKCSLTRAIHEDTFYETEYRVIWPGGTIRYISARGRMTRDEFGNPAKIHGIIWDITEQEKSLEERRKIDDQLKRTQKLEAVGVLAGGIAHDFNNLLNGVYGYMDLARECTDIDSKAAGYLDKALASFLRAKDLTQQLLTFSKGGKPVRKPGHINRLLKESTMFSLSGSSVSAKFQIQEDLWACDFDENQMAQVIDNIVINAIQAMPLGGTVTVLAQNSVLPRNNMASLPEGNYIKIAISDSGVGIAPSIISNIFDPFFTTKDKGSGLGLATVYSIVKNHGGDVSVESLIDKGTTFSILLPASIAPMEESQHVKMVVHQGSGKVLIMDDEESVQEISGVIIQCMGYDVFFAREGKDALDMIKSAHQSHEPFDAVIMDLTIRGGVGGKEAIQELRKFDKNIIAIVSSGYSDDPIMSDPEAYGFDDKIHKPFRRAQMEEVFARHMASAKKS
jgi:PAS domain S-box-containing protein